MIKQHHLLPWSGQVFRQLTTIVPAGEGNSSQAWYCMSVIPDMRLRQEDGEYIVETLSQKSSGVQEKAAHSQAPCCVI